MLDLKELRKDPLANELKLKNKLREVSLSSILSLDQKLREMKTEVDLLKGERNQASKQIGQLKQAGDDSSSLMEKVGIIGQKITQIDQEILKVEGELNHLLSGLPNIPMEDVPISHSADDNVCLKTWGEKKTSKTINPLTPVNPSKRA